MKAPRKFDSAAAFRAALEARLMNHAQEKNIDVQRIRRKVAFDRLLCRLFSPLEPPWILKGGYALELRLKMARATKDVDLGLKPLPSQPRGWLAAQNLLEKLRELGRLNLQDHFVFVFAEGSQDLNGPPYGGKRTHFRLHWSRLQHLGRRHSKNLRKNAESKAT